MHAVSIETHLQAKPVAKNLAFARRVSDSYRRFAQRIAEGRVSYYFNLAGTFWHLLSVRFFKKILGASRRVLDFLMRVILRYRLCLYA